MLLHLHIAYKVASYNGLSGHQHRFQGFSPNTAIDRLSSPINHPALGEKALGTRLSGHTSLLSVQNQQQQTVFIW